MQYRTIQTQPFNDQKPGTSGLRKTVRQFQTAHYLENFVQAIFNSLAPEQRRNLLLGGDGRYYNRQAIQTIVRMAAANGVRRLLVGQQGLLSTPAASAMVRKHGLDGAIILSASHNPGGPDGDFGIKFNIANGGPAPEQLTELFYAQALNLHQYHTLESEDLPLEQCGRIQLGEMEVEIIDPVADYAGLMQVLFDFDAIRRLLASGFSMRFDAMHAITGPYAEAILVHQLGAPPASLMHAVPREDFGGEHPDPNLMHARELVELMLHSEHAVDLGAASDGDGDRNMILGRGIFVTPSDSLAIMAANAHLLPGYRQGLRGVARSMPTSRALDRVAAELGMACYETPTGWKFFGNLLDAGLISLCGEESFGSGSDHIREKDGLWAVLFWLNLLAVSGRSVAEIVTGHWQRFGRHYYSRHDFENVDLEHAQGLINDLRARLDTLAGRRFNDFVIRNADDFCYQDPVDGSFSRQQGIRIEFENDARIIVRMSGTGTRGATLRFYFERYQAPDGELQADSDAQLAPLVQLAAELAGLQERLGRTQADVVT